MNLGEQVLRVQKLFGDTEEAQVDRAFIITALNDAQIDIARKTSVLLKRATSSTLNADSSYELPDDYIALQSVKLNGIRLKREQIRTLDELYEDLTLVSSGTPSLYYVDGRVLWFVPPPNTDGANDIEIRYIKRPTDLEVDNDISDLPITFHEDMVRYALARCKEVDEQVEAAAYIMGDYENNRISTSRNEVYDDDASSYPSVRCLPGDMSYG